MFLICCVSIPYESACVPLGPLPPIGGEVPATGNRQENVISRDTRTGGAYFYLFSLFFPGIHPLLILYDAVL